MANTLGDFLIGIGLSLLFIYILYFNINLITPYYYNGPFVYFEGPFTYGPQAYGCLLTTAGAYFIIRDRRKEFKEATPPSPMEQLPPPLPLMPKQVVKHWQSQFHCDTCGQTFWLDEHRTNIPYCPKCGAPDPKIRGSLSMKEPLTSTL